MKKDFKWIIIALIAIFCAALILYFNGCRQTKKIAEELSAPVDKEMSVLTAVDNYLTDSIGKNYAQGELCIPYAFIVDIDSTDATDTKVYGDFWVFNYKVVGDTLKTVSGGNHPGLMHINTLDSCKVIAFDAVADGAQNMESAKKIFGDKYDAYQTIQSADDRRAQERANITAAYVMEKDLPVTMYQDYGWPPVDLPLER